MQLTRSFWSKTLVATLAIVSASVAGAQSLLRGSLSNFDYYNITGSDANDFELVLVGIHPSQVQGPWLGHYPSATITQVGNATVIRWTGSTTPNGTYSHFGINLPGVDMSQLPLDVKYNYTKDGVVLPNLPGSWQGWLFDESTGVPIRVDIIRNLTDGPIVVRRRVTVVTRPRMDLGELMRDSPLWRAGRIVDQEPVVIPAGGTLEYTFKMPNRNAWAVMMYEQFDTKGQLIATFLNATNDLKTGTGNKLAKTNLKPQKDAKVVAKSKK